MVPILGALVLQAAYGAGNERRAKQALFTGMGVGILVGCVVFAFVLFKGNMLT